MVLTESYWLAFYNTIKVTVRSGVNLFLEKAFKGCVFLKNKYFVDKCKSCLNQVPFLDFFYKQKEQIRASKYNVILNTYFKCTLYETRRNFTQI